MTGTTSSSRPAYVPRPPLADGASTHHGAGASAGSSARRPHHQPPTSRTTSPRGGGGGNVYSSNNALAATSSSTVVSGRDLLATMNASIASLRLRSEHHLVERVETLHERDQKRCHLVQAQHSARMQAMHQRIAEVEAQEAMHYSLRHRLHDELSSRTMQKKYDEMAKRHEFSARREKKLEERNAFGAELREVVYLTPRENRSSRSVSPAKMSLEVAERLLPRSRSPDEPPQSKEVITRLQSQRDEQVEQQRLIQQQQLSEKRKKREEHVQEIKGRLDEIVQKAKSEQETANQRKREKQDRLRTWRWKQRNQLRAEAIERLDQGQPQQEQQQQQHGNHVSEAREEDQNQETEKGRAVVAASTSSGGVSATTAGNSANEIVAGPSHVSDQNDADKAIEEPHQEDHQEKQPRRHPHQPENLQDAEEL